jgi:hypothetical protein
MHPSERQKVEVHNVRQGPHRACREIPYLGIVTSLLYSPDVSCPLRAKSGNTRSEHSMSALPLKADIERHDWHVCLVPIASYRAAAQTRY